MRPWLEEDMMNVAGSVSQICIEAAIFCIFLETPQPFTPGWACSLGGMSLQQLPSPGKVIPIFLLHTQTLFALHISAPEHRGRFSLT